MDCILAIDQGTTSTRCILFDRQGQALKSVQKELTQHFPDDGWVEHDAEEIWASTLELLRSIATHAAQHDLRIASIGITNQRETTVVWERGSGRPIHRAIVWQDRRTAERCRELVKAGHHQKVQQKTGLLLDSYFSATKIAWLLDHVPGARARAEHGDLAFGTIDSFLLWRLTGGRVHATDATNAGRTLLFDIHKQRWDEELCALFGVPAGLLPEVKDNAAAFGVTAAGLLPDQIAIGGMAGDQQAAAIGQACFTPGMVKSTYGTGCFMLMNTGGKAVTSRNALLTTPAYRLEGKTTYALEGSIFVAGAAVQWLRDGLRLIETAGETEKLAAGLGHNAGVYLVPAFTGLGAPYWDPDARRHFRPDPRHRHRRNRARRPGSRLLSDQRPVVGDEGRRRRGHPGNPRRWRHGGQWLAHAVPGRHIGHAGGTPEGHRDHGAGSRLPGRSAGRIVRRRRADRRMLAARGRLHPTASRGGKRPFAEWLA